MLVVQRFSPDGGSGVSQGCRNAGTGLNPNMHQNSGNSQVVRLVAWCGFIGDRCPREVQIVPPKARKTMDARSLLLLGAVRRLIDGLEEVKHVPALCVATSGPRISQDEAKCEEPPHPLWLLSHLPNLVGAQVAMQMGWNGWVGTHGGRRAGSQAVESGGRLLRAGRYSSCVVARVAVADGDESVEGAWASYWQVETQGAGRGLKLAGAEWTRGTDDPPLNEWLNRWRDRAPELELGW